MLSEFTPRRATEYRQSNSWGPFDARAVQPRYRGDHTMKFMEIELDGVVCRSLLNEDKAPKTSRAVWDVLPFEGRAVHAQVSGDMFRMLDETPVGELELESASYFQHPGSVV